MKNISGRLFFILWFIISFVVLLFVWPLGLGMLLLGIGVLLVFVQMR